MVHEYIIDHRYFLLFLTKYNKKLREPYNKDQGPISI